MNINVAAWYEKYGPMVIRRCLSILKDENEALDSVHDVFVNLLVKEKELQGLFPSSLLYTMATNVCLNKLRRKKRETVTDFSSEASYMSSSLTFIDEGFSQVEAEILLEDILSDESEMNRSICYMYHADEMSLKEIGEAVGLSISGVRKRLETFKSRARSKLQKNNPGECL